MLKTKFNPAASSHKVLLLSALGTLASFAITPQADAGIAPIPCPPGISDCQVSSVSDSVTGPANGLFRYEYEVHNESCTTANPDCAGYAGDVIVDWELPYFGDSGINQSTIESPRNWSWDIEQIGFPNVATGWGGVAAWQDPLDPFYAGPNSPFTTATQVLHWYNQCSVGGDFEGADCFGEGPLFNPLQDAIFPGDSLTGFVFFAPFDATAAPYQASWADLPVRSGDPAFPLVGGIPASPMALVPEPGTLPLAVLGAIGAFVVNRRRRRCSS